MVVMRGRPGAGPDPGREAREALELARQLNTPPYKRHPGDSSSSPSFLSRGCGDFALTGFRNDLCVQ